MRKINSHKEFFISTEKSKNVVMVNAKINLNSSKASKFSREMVIFRNFKIFTSQSICEEKI